VKQVPRDWTNVNMLGWMPWENDRTLPFTMAGVRGQAWVKVLGWDTETGAESLVYKLSPGWSAERIENTVPEDLIVWQGELEIGGNTLHRYGYSYRPAGHSVGPCSSPMGATVVAFCGSAEQELYSKIPVPALDTESMPWRRNTRAHDTMRAYWKPLRGDEETLDLYWLGFNAAGSYVEEVATHEGVAELEEAFFFEAGAPPVTLYEAWEGRMARMHGGAGSYVCHGAVAHSAYYKQPNPADMIYFKHDGYAYSEHADPAHEEYLAMFPKETPAVRAFREGRDPGLPPMF